MHISTSQAATSLPFLLLPLLAHAHVKLIQPVPYGASSLNTNPLEASGSDWPCKQRPGVYDITQWNTMPINSQQTIAFQGQATHGGGSCQISLTRDTPPTKDSVFKVIKSIEGGCPSTNAGNVGTDPFGYGADNFTFEIPDVIATGNYTLAWTWFNKIGEREMYMNCAPVTVTAPGKKKRHPHGFHRRYGKYAQRSADGMDSLPDMFRANSGNGCSTAVSGTVLAIPAQNLGNNVQRIGNEPLTPPVGSCREGVVLANESSPSSSAVAHPSALALTPVPSSSVAAQPPTSRAPASSAAPLPSQQPAAPDTQSPVASVSSAAPPPSPPPAESPTQSTAPAAIPSIPGLTTGTCPTPGKSVCSPDGKAWGTCMENLKVIYQPVAVGTKCDQALGVEVPA